MFIVILLLIIGYALVYAGITNTSILTLFLSGFGFNTPRKPL